MNRNQGRAFVVILALLAVATLAVWLFWPRNGEASDTGDRGGEVAVDRRDGGSREDGGETDVSHSDGEGDHDNGGEPDGQQDDNDNANGDDERASRPAVSEAEARRAYRRGRELLDDDELLPARAELSKAVLSGGLKGSEERDAVKRAGELAERTILSREVLPDDPYVSYYTVQSGDTLADRRNREGIVNKLDLWVPSEAILRVNKMRDARSLRAGQDLKVVSGPFHAIITKSGFTCDVYLRRRGRDPVFIKRLRVGLGKNGSTPSGLWQVGSKLPFATWYPPPNAPDRGPIRPGDPDYPLGEKGLWIGIEGLDENTEGRFGYGIHGTDEPESIGREESLGCIRLADDDIEFLFDLLREGHSTVEVRP
ncbi:MAG: L,D-transpeptidase family protein [Phycisphaerae bacterium]